MSLLRNILLLTSLTITTAFTTILPRLPSSHSTKLNFYLPEDGYGVGGGGYEESNMMYGPLMNEGYEHEAMVYDHAMGCANYPGMCDLDELMGLANELEQFQECYIDMGPQACEEEMADRHMLANALYTQREMEIQNMEMGAMPFDNNQRMYNDGFVNNGGPRMNNGYADHDQRMHDSSRYENRAMPNSGKEKGTAHDRAGFIDA